MNKTTKVKLTFVLMTVAALFMGACTNMPEGQAPIARCGPMGDPSTCGGR